MKLSSNIDLTRNSDFRGTAVSLKSFKNMVDITGKKYPWSPSSFKLLTSSVDGVEKELLLTGTKEDMARKKRSILRDGPNSCDCCGYHSEKNWEFKYNLCKRCIDMFAEDETRRKIWFFKDYSISKW